MEFRLCLVCLLLAMAIAAAAKSVSFDHISFSLGCQSGLGECDEFDLEPEMDSEINRRLLAARRRYISYNAMKRNSVPCSRRGRSYYNCNRMKKANPYKRGCSAITRCRRITG
ncbi:hypothetical protein BT93_L4343 [Corymbia citriodora subsp. variegata]|uniref:Protein RALF-like 19 n=1 Tax=Corymbia citriodora subsp. variegata TaxID=360336 RepID=A0A8T0CUA5_CORYI|nr:hypothetical protein BT93_L4343 [Corymbia citriodora subsp. variegata]